jgi:nicotinamide-nucleotide amidase
MTMRIDDDLYVLASQLGRALSDRKAMVATAESCTGGLVAAAITAVAGSSAWFDRGFVTYSNEAKIEQLGVPVATLATHGAVSTETACAMACGARRASRAQWAVAVTGVAGPGGGTLDKPVGMVCFGWAGPGGATSEQRLLNGDRAAVRRESVRIALAGLIDRLA